MYRVSTYNVFLLSSLLTDDGEVAVLLLRVEGGAGLRDLAPAATHLSRGVNTIQIKGGKIGIKIKRGRGQHFCEACSVLYCTVLAVTCIPVLAAGAKLGVSKSEGV